MDEQLGIAGSGAIATGLAVCAARDPKGLYASALRGEIAHFTGVDDPYEPPEAPEVTVQTDRQTVEECVSVILACLEARGLTRPARPATQRGAAD